MDLYDKLIYAILTMTSSPSFGEQGYYFASNGSFSWNDLSASILAHVKGEPVTAEQLPLASTRDLELMAETLGCPVEMVPVNIGGRCVLSAALQLQHSCFCSFFPAAATCIHKML